ncbi:MAG: DUF502 domain-containing protein [Chitinispirillaceae bacterium]|nr:DUF502 domain-containing protein [Chitinispirillaceae bacterium]
MAFRLVKKMFRQLRGNTITGAVLIIPLLVTVIILIQLFQLIDSALPGILGVKMAPGLGVLITLVIAYFAGLAAKNYFGKKLIAVGNNIVASIPFLNKIYLAIQQIVDMVSNNKKQLFERAVLVEYPKENSYTIGFVTSQANTLFSLKVGQKLIAIFIPTTPNPTSGFLLYVPETEIIDTNLPVEAAIKLVVSGGLLGADHVSTAKLDNVGMKKGWKWTDLFTRRHPGGRVNDPRD